MENSRIVDARAWVMKYFIAASDSILFLTFVKRGIIERRLISSPIHINIQDPEDTVIRVPLMVNNKNIIL